MRFAEEARAMSTYASEDVEWFYARSKQQQGPVSFARLASLLAMGKGPGITPETLVWCEGLTSWTRIKENVALLAELQGAAALAAAPPSTAAPAPLPPPPAAPAASSCPALAFPAVTSHRPAAPASAPKPCLRDSDTQTSFPMGGALEAKPVPPVPPPPMPHAAFEDTLLKPPPSRPAFAHPLRFTEAEGGKKHNAIRSFLLSWLPQRSTLSDLLRLGILREHPNMGDKGPGTGTGASGAPEALFGGQLAAHLRRPDTKAGIPALINVLMDRLRSNRYEGLRTEGIFRIPVSASAGLCWPLLASAGL